MLKQEELSKERLEICKQCPIYKEDPLRGPTCDSNKFISPDGTKWSYLKKDGYVRGCSCRLASKTRNPNNHCIISKW